MPVPLWGVGWSLVLVRPGVRHCSDHFRTRPVSWLVVCPMPPARVARSGLRDGACSSCCATPRSTASSRPRRSDPIACPRQCGGHAAVMWRAMRAHGAIDAGARPPQQWKTSGVNQTPARSHKASYLRCLCAAACCSNVSAEPGWWDAPGGVQCTTVMSKATSLPFFHPRNRMSAGLSIDWSMGTSRPCWIWAEERLWQMNDCTPRCRFHNRDRLHVTA